MRVKITNKHNHEWLAVCSQFGVELEPTREVVNLGIDGDLGSSIHYYLVDDDHMATWIKLIKPQWIDHEQSA